jgi:FkbH-like protein
LTDEDRERGRYYAEERRRAELERHAPSLEEFYRTLNQELTIGTVTEKTLSRVAQLTQRTNQFNLTTKRYTEQQVHQMASSKEYEVYPLWVKDRFGDSGLVGVAITREAGEICEVDTLLLSCRVIGRTVESALLSFLVARAKAKGMKRLQGWYLATKKNDPAKDFYLAHNFSIIARDNGATLWAINLDQSGIPCPPWVRLTLPEIENLS